MKTKDIRNKTVEELKGDIEKMEREVIDTYWLVRVGKEDNVRKPRKMRKDLAVMKTVLKEKERDNKLNSKQENG